MVEIIARRARCGAAGLTQFAVDVDDIDQRVAGAQLRETELGRRFAFQRAADDMAIKVDEFTVTRAAQHDMVDRDRFNHLLLPQQECCGKGIRNTRIHNTLTEPHQVGKDMAYHQRPQVTQAKISGGH